MVRVAGTDPGTSSLDVIILDDGLVQDQARFPAVDLQSDPALPVRWLRERGPFDLIAGPSGYGLPLVTARACTERELALMMLVRPDDRPETRKGVLGFSKVLRDFARSDLPIVFLPGIIHLPTVPAHRKINRVDLGTPDKLGVAALAIHQFCARGPIDWTACNLCVIELGSAFTACVVIREGEIVDGVGGTAGPCGWQSGGGWDGESAYLLSPLGKTDLFSGGVESQRDPSIGRAMFLESLRKTVAGLRAVTNFDSIVISGRLLEVQPKLAEEIARALSSIAGVARLEPLAGAWVKRAAQGAASLADGLAGGRMSALVERMRLRESNGTVLDWLTYHRAGELRVLFS